LFLQRGHFAGVKFTGASDPFSDPRESNLCYKNGPNFAELVANFLFILIIFIIQSVLKEALKIWERVWTSKGNDRKCGKCLAVRYGRGRTKIGINGHFRI
jgi:hypothetical protein